MIIVWKWEWLELRINHVLLSSSSPSFSFNWVSFFSQNCNLEKEKNLLSVNWLVRLHHKWKIIAAARLKISPTFSIFVFSVMKTTHAIRTYFDLRWTFEEFFNLLRWYQYFLKPEATPVSCIGLFLSITDHRAELELLACGMHVTKLSAASLHLSSNNH